MRNLLKAEWKKTIHNHKTVSFLVWIIPVAVLAMYIIGIPMAMLSESERQQGLLASLGSVNWIADLTGIYNSVLVFPTLIMGRLFPLSFIGLTMAGEYQWDTWKATVPRTRRSTLLMSKIIMATTIFLISLALTSVINLAGGAIGRAALGMDYPPELNSANLSNLVTTYAVNFGLAALVLFFFSSFGAVVARFSRSVLMTFLGGFMFSLLDTMADVFLIFFGRLLNLPQIVNGYAYSFSYNLTNLMSWLKDGNETLVSLSGWVGGHSALYSIILLAVWVGGMFALALWLFQRQDLTS
jgi:ABC-type transport system involved in multi-copper enzyme maturation permease subunit